VKVRHKLLLSL